ncbi:hypothetical protein ACFPJ4_10210 [Lysinimonas soli]|uniref:Uncharacterized protein n=1 Tax=Lysinimonas soli TaxID=1074233 RepID=A0ABW0NSS4_9MICO
MSQRLAGPDVRELTAASVGIDSQNTGAGESAPFAKPDGGIQANQARKAALKINLDPTLLASATVVG